MSGRKWPVVSFHCKLYSIVHLTWCLISIAFQKLLLKSDWTRHSMSAGKYGFCCACVLMWALTPSVSYMRYSVSYMEGLQAYFPSKMAYNTIYASSFLEAVSQLVSGMNFSGWCCTWCWKNRWSCCLPTLCPTYMSWDTPLTPPKDRGKVKWTCSLKPPIFPFFMCGRRVTELWMQRSGGCRYIGSSSYQKWSSTHSPYLLMHAIWVVGWSLQIRGR